MMCKLISLLNASMCTWAIAWVPNCQGVEDTEEKAGKHSTAVLEKASVRMLPNIDDTENINTPDPDMCAYQI